MNRKSLKQHLVEGPIIYGFTLHFRIRDYTTWFWRCLGTAFGHFLLGSHNFMVTALGSCVKWPLAPTPLSMRVEANPNILTLMSHCNFYNPLISCRKSYT